MKKALFTIILCMIMVLTSCNSGSTEYITVESLNSFYDGEKTSIPSDEDIKQIKAGMRMTDVIDLIGYPHREAGFFSSPSNTQWVWYTADEHIAIVTQFIPMEGAPENTAMEGTKICEYYLNYCTAGIFILLDTNILKLVHDDNKVYRLDGNVIWSVSSQELSSTVTDTTQ